MWQRKKILRVAGLASLGLVLIASAFTLYLDHRVRTEFEGRRFALPARIYARPLELHAGLRLALPDLGDERRELGYKPLIENPDPTREAGGGWYVRSGERLDVGLRAFMFWDGPQPARQVRLAFDGGTRRPPTGNEDRVLGRLAEVPPHLVKALIATEDRTYFTHAGFSLRSMARAALSIGSSRMQGGSTITQQLVKNFFLTPERTLRRKLTELVMAVLLEVHYGKEEILETYLNEIYLGQDRDRAIHGVGLAAQYYFGKEVQHLTVAESALLVALVKGPAVYDPHRHPAKALERRNLVLRETREQNAITMEQYAAPRAADLGVARKPGFGPRRPRGARERPSVALRGTGGQNASAREQCRAARAADLGVSRKPGFGTSPY